MATFGGGPSTEGVLMTEATMCWTLTVTEGSAMRPVVTALVADTPSSPDMGGNNKSYAR